MARKMTQQKLTDIFASSALQHGLVGLDVRAEFVPLSDFKVTWARTSDKMELEVSDYIDHAPVKVVRGIADTIFGRITGQSESGYPECVMEHLSSEDFAAANQKRWIDRHVVDEDTDSSLLMELLGELEQDGLFKPVPNACVTWGRDTKRHSGNTSVTMRVVVMNDKLKGASRCTVKYALYEQALLLQRGFDPMGQYRSNEYKNALTEYMDALPEEDRETVRREFKLCAIDFA